MKLKTACTIVALAICCTLKADLVISDVGSPLQLGTSYVNGDADRLDFSVPSPNPATYSSAVLAGDYRDNNVSSEPGGNTGFSFPVMDRAAGANIGPNAEFTTVAVPEPSTWLLGV